MSCVITYQMLSALIKTIAVGIQRRSGTRSASHVGEEIEPCAATTQPTVGAPFETKYGDRRIRGAYPSADIPGEE